MGYKIFNPNQQNFKDNIKTRPPKEVGGRGTLIFTLSKQNSESWFNMHNYIVINTKMCSTDHLSDSNQTHLHVQSSTQKSSMQASNGYTSFMFIILDICNLKHYFNSANKILLKNTHTHTHKQQQQQQQQR